MYKLSSLLLFLTVARFSNGGIILPATTVYIVNGTRADHGQFPYMASIRYGGGHNCGGAILNERWIITAAHCAKDEYTADLLSVEVGSNNLKEGEVYAVEQKIPHPEWDSRANINDIALIKVDRDISFSNSVQRIPLSSENQFVPDRANITIAGWGYTKYPSNFASPHLLYTFGYVVNRPACQDQWASTVITQDHLCVQNPDYHTGTCLGDSGSPYVFEGRVVGVHIFGDWCKIEKPGVATNVNNYLHWIQQQQSLYPN